jgi:hypothetical protein
MTNCISFFLLDGKSTFLDFPCKWNLLNPNSEKEHFEDSNCVIHLEKKDI